MIWWHVVEDHRVRTDNGAVAHCNSTDNLATHAECYVVSNSGLSFVPEVCFVDHANAGVNPAIVANNNTIGNHDSKAGVHVEPLTDHCAGPYVGSRHGGND